MAKGNLGILTPPPRGLLEAKLVNKFELSIDITMLIDDVYRTSINSSNVLKKNIIIADYHNIRGEHTFSSFKIVDNLNDKISIKVPNTGITYDIWAAINASEERVPIYFSAERDISGGSPSSLDTNIYIYEIE